MQETRIWVVGRAGAPILVKKSTLRLASYFSCADFADFKLSNALARPGRVG